jgi:ribose transport system ATP-binding protein
LESIELTNPSDVHLPRLELRHVFKTFPGQKALIGVDLTILPGQVHALVGQNGSGKSTLVKLLAGYEHPDPGAEAWSDGTPFQLGVGALAQAHGMRFIHQDLGLIGELDVVDNLALGSRGRSLTWVDAKKERAAAARALQELGAAIDPRRLVRDLSPAERTQVAVARALRDRPSNGGLLIMDEPTATLSKGEVDALLGLVATVTAGGMSVLYVTHRLEEVVTIAEMVTVLREGRGVSTDRVDALDRSALVEMIVGRPMEESYRRASRPVGSTAMSVRRLAGKRVTDVSFEVREGEVVGFAGVTGSGREELAELLFGSRPLTAGEVDISGATVFRRDQLNPVRAIKAGVGLVPADRKKHGSIPVFSIRENVTLPRPIARRRSRWLSYADERRDVRRWLERFAITTNDPDRTFSTLSGGNQQRVILARWFRAQTRTLILDEPTQGVDVEAKQFIYDTLDAATLEGLSIVLCSSDNDELATLCDVVYVLRDGEIYTALRGQDIASGTISLASQGGAV